MAADTILEELLMYVKSGLIELRNSKYDGNNFYLTVEGLLIYSMSENGVISGGVIDAVRIVSDNGSAERIRYLASLTGSVLKMQEKGLIRIEDHRFALTEVSTRYLAFLKNVELEVVEKSDVYEKAEEELKIKEIRAI